MLSHASLSRNLSLQKQATIVLIAMFHISCCISDLFLANLVHLFSCKSLDFAYEACDGRRKLYLCCLSHQMDFRSPTGVLLTCEVMLLRIHFDPDLAVLFVW